MKKSMLRLSAAMGVLSCSLVMAAPAVDPNSVYGEPPAANSGPTLQQQRNVNDQNAIIILRLESFKPMGTFTVPEEIEHLSVVQINNKTYVLSEQPDKRLAGLWIGRNEVGQEALCGYLNNSMHVQKCYYILFRER
ncbi:hypothetical protein [Photorhabdus hindustanensis]|uniref:Uncharacterized protein n=1 Tax=Photorhabdus hindustanensis TaxID=2918802 RepID=A0A2S8PTY2_9GAMM|nr:hypothetical protein [Photorhabdus hindustanensis]PQQ22217.1 hypothetical protein C6H66_24490 [Photorhabdus hindustanensis]